MNRYFIRTGPEGTIQGAVTAILECPKRFYLYSTLTGQLIAVPGPLRDFGPLYRMQEIDRSEWLVEVGTVPGLAMEAQDSGWAWWLVRPFWWAWRRRRGPVEARRVEEALADGYVFVPPAMSGMSTERR